MRAVKKITSTWKGARVGFRNSTQEEGIKKGRGAISKVRKNPG